jgi:DNA-binding transcriptional MocR family regulator
MEPEGGYFVGLNLPRDMQVPNLRDEARKVGLGLSDGRGFFAQGGGEGFIRLAFPALSVSDIQEGIARLARLVRAE